MPLPPGYHKGDSAQKARPRSGSQAVLVAPASLILETLAFLHRLASNLLSQPGRPLSSPPPPTAAPHRLVGEPSLFPLSLGHPPPFSRFTELKHKLTQRNGLLERLVPQVEAPLSTE